MSKIERILMIRVLRKMLDNLHTDPDLVRIDLESLIMDLKRVEYIGK